MYKWSAITKWSEWSLMFSGGRGLEPSAEAARKENEEKKFCNGNKGIL